MRWPLHLHAHRRASKLLPRFWRVLDLFYECLRIEAVAGRSMREHDLGSLRAIDSFRCGLADH